MGKARKILRRAKAIRSIGKVTKTMNLVATARFKKSYDRLVAARPYTTRLSEILAEVVTRCAPEELDHPLLKGGDLSRPAVLLVLTSHRGLCGAYNSSVVRLAAERASQLQAAGATVWVRSSGRKGTQLLRGRGMALDREYTQFDYLPDARAVAALADELMGQFLTGATGGLEVAYMQYISAGQQKPAIAQVLPVAELAASAAPEKARPVVYEFLPSPGEVLRDLLPAGVRLKLYQCFLDAAVSEQIYRRAAMQAASENAEEMIHNLTVQYNRARQAQITTELAEIMGGAEGLK